MKKSTGIVKRVLALFLVVLMSIESFAAVVSDNDGSAFITKAEFDSLKNNFQAQIDQYNTSIDSKIDGAIASYLAGITVAKKTTEKFFDGKGAKVLICDASKINDLKWGTFALDISQIQSKFGPDTETATQTNTGSAYGKWVAKRPTATPFECFRYNADTSRLIAYSNDLKVKFTTIRNNNSFATWSKHASSDTSAIWGIRWHSCAYPEGNSGKYGSQALVFANWGSDVFTSNQQFYSTYNMWLAAPNWTESWNTGININYAGNIGTPDYFQSDKIEIQNETKINLIFDDTTIDQRNKIWTPCYGNTENIILECLHAGGHPTDDDVFAYNYDKTGRTLRFDTPGDAGLALTETRVWAYNNDYSRFIHRTNLLSWRNTGSTSSGSLNQITCDYWYEPYFENDSLYSKNIINNIDDSKINEFSSYGFTGALTEGLPIGLFKEDDECEFEINLPTAMSIGLRSQVFNAGTIVLNTANDANLEVTIDNVKKTNSNNEVAAGNHKFKIKYVGSGSKPIFIKIGRANADLSTTYRYIVTLPTEYTQTTT